MKNIEIEDIVEYSEMNDFISKTIGCTDFEIRKSEITDFINSDNMEIEVTIEYKNELELLKIEIYGTESKKETTNY